jgi:hypothetical protein
MKITFYENLSKNHRPSQEHDDFQISLLCTEADILRICNINMNISKFVINIVSYSINEKNCNGGAVV